MGSHFFVPNNIRGIEVTITINFGQISLPDTVAELSVENEVPTHSMDA